MNETGTIRYARGGATVTGALPDQSDLVINLLLERPGIRQEPASPDTHTGVIDYLSSIPKGYFYTCLDTANLLRNGNMKDHAYFVSNYKKH